MSEQSTLCGLSLTLVVQQGAVLHRLPKALGQGTARPWEQSCWERAAWRGGQLALYAALPLTAAKEHLEESTGVSPGVFLFSCLKLTKWPVDPVEYAWSWIIIILQKLGKECWNTNTWRIGMGQTWMQVQWTLKMSLWIFKNRDLVSLLKVWISVFPF